MSSYSIVEQYAIQVLSLDHHRYRVISADTIYNHSRELGAYINRSTFRKYLSDLSQLQTSLIRSNGRGRGHGYFLRSYHRTTEGL